MTSLLCPDDEEPAEDVLGRLKIERTDDNRLAVGYRKAGTRKMQLQRWTAESKSTEVDRGRFARESRCERCDDATTTPFGVDGNGLRTPGAQTRPGANGYNPSGIKTPG